MWTIHIYCMFIIIKDIFLQNKSIKEYFAAHITKIFQAYKFNKYRKIIGLDYTKLSRENYSIYLYIKKYHDITQFIFTTR